MHKFATEMQQTIYNP